MSDHTPGGSTHRVRPPDRPARRGPRRSLFAGDARGAELKAESRDWPSHDLTPRQLCDLELLVSGGFSPLTGFLGRRDHERVCAEMRLGDGTLWPRADYPRRLGGALASSLSPGSSLALRDAEGRDAGRARRRGRLAARPCGGSRSGVRNGQPGAPGRRAPARPDATVLCRGAGDRRAAGDPLRLPVCCATRRPSCAPSSPSWAGRRWSLSRPATPCTGRTRS